MSERFGLFVACCAAHLLAGGCDPCDGPEAPEVDMLLVTQQDVDDLVGVLCVDGDLDIGAGEGDEPTLSGDITSLAPLADLRFVEGDLTIKGNAALVSLEGLGSVEYIGRRLYLRFSDVVGDLNIQSNPLLTDVSALQNVDGVAGCTTITDNASLDTGDVEDLLAAVKTHAPDDTCTGGEHERAERNGEGGAAPQVELCDNAFDDDGDLSADCEDTDCEGAPECG